MILNLKKVLLKKINTKNCYKYKKNNLYQIPKFKTIILSSHFNKVFNDNLILQDLIIKQMMILTGVKPEFSRIKKSNADFDIRKKYKTGLITYITKKKMFNFLTYLVFFVLNYLKELKTISSSNFDNNYNFNFGISEYMLFDIIEFTPDNPNFGLNCTFKFTKINKQCISDMLKIFLILKK